MTVKGFQRGIYILPNLFTTAALFAGFYAVIAAMQNDFEVAALSIFVALIFDGLDGRIARMTNTSSAFGAEYDSLADMVSFGVAPALIAFQWALADLGKPGWIAAFVFTAGAALRLARFNTQVGIADKRYFQGLPSPAAAAVIASVVWIFAEVELTPFTESLMLVLTIFTGLMMVSNFRYYSFKEFNLKHKVPFIALLGVVLAFVIVSIDPPLVLLAFFAVYLISGPVVTLVQLNKARKNRKRQPKAEQKEGSENE